MNRRVFGLMLCCGCIPVMSHSKFSRSALAQGTALEGCMIIPDVDGNLPKDVFDIQNGPIHSGSGNGSFDQALGKILVMLSQDFGVLPGFAFFDDDLSGNALASSHPRLARDDGTIVVGLNLVRNQLQIENGEIAIALVAAHEFGHIYQYKTGLYDHFRAKCFRFTAEQHADFLAGWFLRKLEQRRTNISLLEAGRWIERNNQSTFTNPGTHGPRELRIRAAEAGYSYAKSNPDAAVGSASDWALSDYLNNFCA